MITWTTVLIIYTNHKHIGPVKVKLIRVPLESTTAAFFLTSMLYLIAKQKSDYRYIPILDEFICNSI